MGNKICTCVGFCKGKEGLGEGWTCALEEADRTDAAPPSPPPDSAVEKPGDWTGAWCVECGIQERVDECGGCLTCVRDAVGEGVEQALTALRTQADPAIAAWREMDSEDIRFMVKRMRGWMGPPIHTRIYAKAAAALEALGKGK